MTGTDRRSSERAVPASHVVVAISSLFCIASAPLPAQTYPVKPVRIIVPFPPGGPTDAVARVFAGKLGEAWGQQVIVDNRGGANTILGAELTARSAPDGYTLFQSAAATHVNNALLYRKLPYDGQKSFAPISMLVINPYVLAVHPSLPATNLKELVALARRRPGELSYASSGTGSSGHLAGVLFDSMAGIRTVHVPYKGTAAALLDTMSGQVPLYFATMASINVHYRQGKFRVLGFATPRRHPAWPDIPTIDESGYPGYEMNTWYGLVAPAGTPRAIIDRVNAEVVRAAAMPDVMKRLAALDLDILTNTPEEFAAYIARDIARVAGAVKASGIILD